MDWQHVVEKVKPYVVKIETPNGHGTGFLCLRNKNATICGIATAAHVVDHSHEWEEPIRIYSYNSDGKILDTVLLKDSERLIRINWQTDSAVIVFTNTALQLPQGSVPLLPTNTVLPIGVEVGWLGFPAIERFRCCFFSGNVSANDDSRKGYLIDGVAINGVSGGPVVYNTATDGAAIVGVMTEYRANRRGGEALPGLSFAQDVSHFHAVITEANNVDEAKEKAKEADNASEEKPA
jgi:hypothetical protein